MGIFYTEITDRARYLKQLREGVLDGASLQDAPRFQNDKEVVVTAVYKNGNALEFASERLQDDETVVKYAVRKGKGFEYASDRLRDDYKTTSWAVSCNGLALQWASARLRDNERVVMFAIENNPKAIKYASPRLQKELEDFYEKMVDKKMKEDDNRYYQIQNGEIDEDEYEG